MTDSQFHRLVAIAVGVFFPIAASAAIHLWKVNEVYSNSDGTIQYVELTTNSDFQNMFSGTLLTSSSGGNMQSVTFNQNTSVSTANKKYLIATPRFAALGIVTPDFIIPAGFLYLTNGSVSFGPYDTASYAALPTNGIDSLNRISLLSFGAGTVATNSPTNFALVQGSLSPPGAPTISGTTAGDGRAQVRFAAPSSSGSAAVSSYAVKCNNGGADIVANVTRSAALVTGLTNLSPYTCRVSAANAVGSGPDSVTASVTPDAAAVPALFSVVSRKTHGAAGDLDVPIDIDALIDGSPSVESRNVGSGHKLLLNFNVPIFSVGLVSLTDPMSGGLCCVNPAYNGFDTTLSIVNLSSAQRLTVSLEAFNGGGSGASFPIVFMPGDVTSSRRVNAADISAVKARTGAANASNARFDINLDGTISSSDTSIVKSKSGTVVP